jgi:hypothetical protein
LIDGLRSNKETLVSKLAIDSNVVAPSDVHMIQSYANRLGQESKLQGFANFAEQSAFGVFSAAIGVLVNEQPVLLSTIAASREPSGAVLWSARGLDNTQLPGTPDTYSNVTEALRAMDDYMIHMARKLAEHSTPKKNSFFQRLFSR